MLARWLPAAREIGPTAYARALRHAATVELRLANLEHAVAHACCARRVLAEHGVVGAHDDGWARIVLAAVHLQRDELAEARDQLNGLASTCGTPTRHSPSPNLCTWP